jgi:serine/threonine protein kinase
MEIREGTVLGNFTVIKPIGEGGMSEVYLVQDNLDRQFAMKVLSANLSRDPSFKERFKQEAKIMANLHHPHIVQLHSFFDQDDLYCLVMEYVEGGSLKDLIKQNGPIPEERALKIFHQIAEALAYAHDKGVIHRDIKPSNILIGKYDIVKVMDFGIARMTESPGLTRTGTQMGTLVYMSPEQIKDSKHVDSKTDVYSLGVTLYEMLTGKAPYDETTDSEFNIQEKIVYHDLPDPRDIYPHISDTTISLLKSLTQRESAKRPDVNKMSEKQTRVVETVPPQQPKPKLLLPVDEQVVQNEEALIDETESYNSSAKWAVILIGIIAVIALISSGVLSPKHLKQAAVDTSRTGYKSSQTVTSKQPSQASVNKIGNDKMKQPALVELVYVAGGTFTMGDTFGDGDDDEKPAHQVTVSSFYIGKYEVTQFQWQNIMGSNPSHLKGDNRPVEQVSWYDCVEFCNKLSQKEGLTPCYKINGAITTCDWSANGYRLPTEAEWEYTAKGGSNNTDYKYSGSNDISNVAWYYQNSSGQSHTVGQKRSNDLGIYDMSGNIFEWCWDWYNGSYYSNNPSGNPRGPQSGDYRRVLRGGAWGYYTDKFCRVSHRYCSHYDNLEIYIGLRMVRAIP